MTRVLVEVQRAVTVTVSAQAVMRTLATLVPPEEEPFITRRAASTTLTARVSLLLSSANLYTEYSLDIPGAGGVSGTGNANGGDAAVEKRALDSQTAGGNAHSGSSSDTSSGGVVNKAQDDGEITNTMASE